ncbi:MAG: FRG domain protein [Candidatus Accumulibacter regalis]|uniref:FRG domain protein n=1 Tax=Accumulibacter regalis TaxID=522306 RepID=A0A011Q2Y7_ACCRE|nr:FRG domain-containing protein [Accumulibacter sp.]EXI83627.1 MAG: FRG domain protein [Candidatus Accumulibacter regalis]HRE73012.1 FRG domain-containing protein [Accumulibacter sp.]
MRITALELARRLREQQEAQQKWAEEHFETMDDGHFMAVSINEKECVLAPYPEFSAFIYRGQPQYYESCMSSLFRSSPNQLDRFIAEMKVAEFQLLLSDHPAIVDFSHWSVMGLTFRIDYEALAQHYGLNTSLMDFTSNPHVAAFFACCEYDNSLHQYRPILRSTQEGIIYSYLAAAEIGDPTGPEEFPSSIIGLQPLRRPAEQYAWCYRLAKRTSLNSRRYVTPSRFVHDPMVSKKVFEEFEGGAKLFPYDPISEKARQIFATKELSKGAFDMVLSRYSGRMKERSTLNALNRKGFTVVDAARVVLTKVERVQIEKEWIERRSDLASRIHYRRACYP